MCVRVCVCVQCSYLWLSLTQLTRTFSVIKKDKKRSFIHPSLCFFCPVFQHTRNTKASKCFKKKIIRTYGIGFIVSSLYIYFSISLLLKIFLHRLALWLECSPMARETCVRSQVELYQRLKKMVLDASLLNTQHYKVRIKGKVEQSRERSSALPYTRCSSYQKGRVYFIWY